MVMLIKLHGAGLRRVVTEGKLFHVTMQVLGAHEVMDAAVAALQKRPEAFVSVGVGHIMHILADRVIDRLVGEPSTMKRAVA